MGVKFNPFSGKFDLTLSLASIKSYLDSFYIWAAGKAGGQNVMGDTASGGNLTLTSTAHSTKGKILADALTVDEVNHRVGVNQTTPLQSFDETGVFMVRGTYTGGETLNVSGVGSRMFYYPKKGAFRAGVVDSSGPTYWDDANIGSLSIAMGSGSKASNIGSIAVGIGVVNAASQTVLFGSVTSATVNSGYSVGIGYGNVFTAGIYCAIVGKSNTITAGTESNIFGVSNTSNCAAGQAVILGTYNTNTADYGTIIGYLNTLTPPAGGVVYGTILIGNGLSTNRDGYVLLGSNANTLWIADTGIFSGGAVGIGMTDPTTITDRLTVNGNIKPTGYKSSDGSAGISTTITTSSLVGKTITIKNGLITGFA